MNFWLTSVTSSLMSPIMWRHCLRRLSTNSNFELWYFIYHI